MKSITQLGEPTTRLRGGGKWLGLSRLRALGARVPSAFCIDADSFRELAQRLSLGALTASLENAAEDDLAPLAAQLRARIRTAPMEDTLIAGILDAYAKLGARSTAVRSSATDEDHRNSSFAGQYDTLLDVRGADALLEAVRTCWASTFSDRAVGSRRRLGLSQQDVAMAVVVQELVAAETSGVAFTRHPLEARPVMLVEACRGLGERLVSGSLDPDRFEVDREGAGWCCVSDVEGSGLTGDQILGMRDEFLRLEAGLGFAADLEWAWEAGRLFLLQARPITTKPTAAPEDMEDDPRSLRGTAAAPGRADGRARVLLDANQDELSPGDVLVTPFTDPSWTRHFSRACALVMEHGGLLCHGAILARECGIPAVVGVRDATLLIAEGSAIRVDGNIGRVERP